MSAFDKKNNGAEGFDDISASTYDAQQKYFALNLPQEETVPGSGEISFASGNAAQRAGSDLSDIDFNLFTSGQKTRESQTAVFEAPKTSAAPKNGGGAKSAGKKTASKKASGGNGGKKSSEKKKAGASADKTAAPVKKKKKKKKKKKNIKKSIGLALLIMIFVGLISAIVRVPVLGCMNDILAIDRDTNEIRVILDRRMTTSEVLDLLDQKGLIYSANFCKIISNLLGYARIRDTASGHLVDREYEAGTYYLSPSMGVEGMLREIYTSGVDKSTVSLTFPEGYTVDQIVDRLALNGVASEAALYEVLDSESFYENYDFLQYVTNREQRYRSLEGYLYPDTYEFYIGENPESVFNRFLSNFSAKWDENYAALAEDSEYTIDQILTVASILQKEAADPDQMAVIASIIYNRLNSADYPFINCDSTGKYIEAHEEELTAAGTYVNLMMRYDTYQKNGLPVGPICNPGADAILAALDPDETDYYFFLHDPDGNIYTARTEAEHAANKAYLGE